MTRAQLEIMVQKGLFPGAPTPASLVETHISWVILSPEFAFKIKKPIQLHFLDFSNLEKRRYYCAEELRLNQRLAPNMYLAVRAICNGPEGPFVSTSDQPTDAIDYAVQMCRQDNTLQMDTCIKEHTITINQMQSVAAVLAPFHLNNRIPAPTVPTLLEDFEDLFTLRNTFKSIVGKIALLEFDGLPESIAHFLKTHKQRLQERADLKFWVDGHGDLHTRNIFLTKPPLVFDCVEFNPHFRQLDILNELAFLCMELEFYQQPALVEAFLNAYQEYWSVMPLPEDRSLFTYFKAYRANVRLKITLLELEMRPSEILVEVAKKYWNLMAAYCRRLNEG